MNERYEFFCEKWNELSDNDKLNLYQEYCSYTGNGTDLFSFDDEFFNLFFEGKPLEAARATHFGEVNWSDEYISFNGYGNLKSYSNWEAVQLANDYMSDIYDWDRYQDYIDMDEFDNPDEDEEELDEENEDVSVSSDVPAFVQSDYEHYHSIVRIDFLGTIAIMEWIQAHSSKDNPIHLNHAQFIDKYDRYALVSLERSNASLEEVFGYELDDFFERDGMRRYNTGCGFYFEIHNHVYLCTF